MRHLHGRSRHHRQYARRRYPSLQPRRGYRLDPVGRQGVPSNPLMVRAARSISSWALGTDHDPRYQLLDEPTASAPWSFSSSPFQFQQRAVSAVGGWPLGPTRAVRPWPSSAPIGYAQGRSALQTQAGVGPIMRLRTMNDDIPGEETETVPALGVWTASEQVETWAAPGGPDRGASCSCGRQPGAGGCSMSGDEWAGLAAAETQASARRELLGWVTAAQRRSDRTGSVPSRQRPFRGLVSKRLRGRTAYGAAARRCRGGRQLEAPRRRGRRVRAGAPPDGHRAWTCPMRRCF